MNRDLREVLVELDDLVAQSSTALSLQRLRDTFDSARRFSEWVVPAQTVCNYWNYWFTFLPEALSDRDQVGYTSARPSPTRPSARVAVHVGPGDDHGPGRDAWSGRRLLGRPGHGPARRPAEPSSTTAMFEPEAQPTVHGNPFGPTGQKDADCQGGQTGYLLGRLPIPGQPASNPSVGRRRHPRLDAARRPSTTARTRSSRTARCFASSVTPASPRGSHEDRLSVENGFRTGLSA